MKRMAGYLVVAVVAVALWACAGTPGPGDPGYAFNLSGTYQGEIVVDGTPFGAKMEVLTGVGGALEGTYEVLSPVEMAGAVTGAVVADSVTFQLNYLNPMDGCGGVMDGKGTVEEGGDAFSGRAQVNDSCGGFLSGTFALQK